jgi:hypothetical protein
LPLGAARLTPEYFQKKEDRNGKDQEISDEISWSRKDFSAEKS